MPRVIIDPTAYVDDSCVLLGEISIGKWSRICAGTIIQGEVTIGDYTTVWCNVAIRGGVVIIGNYVQIYDNVCIEAGRGKGMGTARENEKTILKDKSWINHGAAIHGCEVDEGAVVGLNAALDYGCKVGKGAIVANGSACRVGAVIPPNSLAEGVPAKIIKQNISDQDRLELLGLVPNEVSELMAESTVNFLKLISPARRKLIRWDPNAE